jgi:hypothetical protein
MQSIIATTGIIGTSSLAVTQAGTPGMAVQVAAGWGAIVGDFTTNMGVYQFYNDAATQLSVTAANPTNPRIDRVVVTVNDSYYTGATNNVTFTVVAGTAAASPTAPATPTNSISLATIAVAAGATSIVNANITDTRVSVTTNLPVGDITEVQGGTGITVTSGTGPIPSVAINTAVTADLTTSQTLTNKTLTSPTINDGKLNLTLNAQVASYTAVLTDNGKLVEISNASANNFTIPLNSSVAFPVGSQINILQTGAGQTTVVATGGVTINATPGLKLRAQYSSATCIKRATDTWVVVGDLSA